MSNKLFKVLMEAGLDLGMVKEVMVVHQAEVKFRLDPVLEITKKTNDALTRLQEQYVELTVENDWLRKLVHAHVNGAEYVHNGQYGSEVERQRIYDEILRNTEENQP